MANYTTTTTRTVFPTGIQILAPPVAHHTSPDT